MLSCVSKPKYLKKYSEYLERSIQVVEIDGLSRYRTLIFWPYAESNTLEPRLDGRVEQMCTVSRYCTGVGEQIDCSDFSEGFLTRSRSYEKLQWKIGIWICPKEFIRPLVGNVYTAYQGSLIVALRRLQGVL